MTLDRVPHAADRPAPRSPLILRLARDSVSPSAASPRSRAPRRRPTGRPNRPEKPAPPRHDPCARPETEKSPANVAAALHLSATRSLDEVRPLDPPIQSPLLLLPRLVESYKSNPTY